MRADPRIRPIEEGDCYALAALMREADRAELLAAHGMTPLEALLVSVRDSERVVALELGGELAALAGVVPGPRPVMLAPAHWHTLWALTGRACDRFPLAYVRASRDLVDVLRLAYPVLRNHVHARYEAAVRWAQFLGAEVQPAVRWGVAGELFHPVVWRSPWAQA